MREVVYSVRIMERHFEAYEERLLRTKRSDEGNREVLGKILEAIASDRFEDAAPYLAEDMEMDIHGFVGMSGAWTGREAVLEALRRNFSMVMDQRPKIIDVVESDGKIAVRFEEGGRFRRTRQLYAMRGLQWFQFEDGRLKYFEQYLQPIPVLPEGMP